MKIMKKLTLIIFLFPLCVSCKYRFGEKKDKTGSVNSVLPKSDDSARKNLDSTVIDPLNKSSIVKFRFNNVGKDTILNRDLLTSFPDVFLNVTINDIKKIEYIRTANIRNWGKTGIYKFELSEQLPESIYKKGVLIINKQREQAAIFFLDNFDLIKLKETDTAYFLSGIHILKSKGHFYLYDFDGNQYFQCKFNTLSDKYCHNGIPVFNNSLECICYKPFELIFKNIDTNNDGLMDLNFSGNLLSFCEGLENGYGREDKNLRLYLN
jgi:hypothetical protein